MFRDPSEFRRLYKVWKDKTQAYYDAIEKMLSGADPTTLKMDTIIQEMKVAHEAWMEESKHFVKWDGK